MLLIAERHKGYTLYIVIHILTTPTTITTIYINLSISKSRERKRRIIN